MLWTLLSWREHNYLSNWEVRCKFQTISATKEKLNMWEHFCLLLSSHEKLNYFRKDLNQHISGINAFVIRHKRTIIAFCLSIENIPSSLHPLLSPKYLLFYKGLGFVSWTFSAPSTQSLLTDIFSGLFLFSLHSWKSFVAVPRCLKVCLVLVTVLLAFFIFLGAYAESCCNLASSTINGQREMQHQGVAKARASHACPAPRSAYLWWWRLAGRK